MVANQTAPLLIGREAQMEVLRTAVAAAAAGDGRLVLVSGEPGIGKTRLAEQLAHEAAFLGVPAHWSQCWQHAGMPPLWPWARLIRALGGDADDITRLAGHPAGLTSENEETRFRLFDRVTAFLRRAAAPGPLLLIMDDLHWADTASLQLLRHVSSELHGVRALVAGAYRDGEVGGAHAELLHGMAGAHEHLVLQGLRQPEVRMLMEQLTGVAPDERQVAVMQQRTGGNPLFVRELVRLLDGPGTVDDRLPWGVRDVIRRRLDRLSSPCRALLATAAVIGPRFRLDLLQTASGLQTTLLREAADAQVVEEVAGAATIWRFTHTLAAEVIVDELEPGARRELHRHVVGAIEERYRDDLAPRLAQLAYHARLAGDLVPREMALDYTVRAGRRAHQLLAYEEAAGHLATALELLDDGPGEDRRARRDLLLALADAQMAAGTAQLARDSYRLAAELARALGEPDALAHAALGVHMGQTVGIADALEIRLLEEALEAVGTADSAVRTRLLARLAGSLHCTSSYERRRTLSEQAVATARRLGDRATLAATLHDHCSVIATYEGGRRVLPVCDEMIRLATQSGEHRLALHARWARIGALVDVGELDAVRTEVEIADDVARELRRPDHCWQAPLVRASLALLAARLDEAEALAGLGLRLGQLAHEPAVQIRHGTIVVLVRYLQGRLAELEPLLRELASSYPAAPEWRCVLALALWHAGRTDEARHELAPLAADDFASLARHTPRHSLLAMLAVACDALGDARRAEALFPLLSPHGESFLPLGAGGIGSLGSAWHYLGLLSCARGRWAEAAEQFERAIERNRRIGAVAFVANSRFQCARALSALGDPAAQGRAAEHLRQAREAERSLGLGLWRGGGPATRPASSPLSRREWEVAQLVGDGLSNHEIAARLFISKRTAETHVDHVRKKLDVTSRAGIVAWVIGRRARS